MYLILKESPGSLESITSNGQIVTLIGRGRLKSPGHPAGNQQLEAQVDFFSHASISPYLFSIFLKDIYGRMEYLGEYFMVSNKIKMSFEGFRYYEFKMLRRNKPDATPVFPPG